MKENEQMEETEGKGNPLFESEPEKETESQK